MISFQTPQCLSGSCYLQAITWWVLLINLVRFTSKSLTLVLWLITVSFWYQLLKCLFFLWRQLKLIWFSSCCAYPCGTLSLSSWHIGCLMHNLCSKSSSSGLAKLICDKEAGPAGNPAYPSSRHWTQAQVCWPCALLASNYLPSLGWNAQRDFCAIVIYVKRLYILVGEREALKLDRPGFKFLNFDSTPYL